MDSRVEKEKLKKLLTSTSNIDDLVDVLIQNGVTFKEKAHWKDRIIMTHNPLTGKKDCPFKEGYVCSKCGKYEYYKAPYCDGCKSKMMK